MKAFPDFVRLQMVKQNDLTESQKETIYMQSSGMDLRDYFAAKAMQGMLSLTPEQLYTAFSRESTTLSESVAKNSYNFADAMMKAREQ